MDAAGRRKATTGGAELELEDDGTVVIRIKHVDLTAALMREILDAEISLRAERGPALIDTRRVRSMTREAQALSASPEVGATTSCLALLVDNPLTVVLANMFMAFVRPPYPTKMFRREADARAWLHEENVRERLR